MWAKTAPKQGEMTPDAWNFSRNAKLGTWNGLQLYKACIIGTWCMKTEARKPQNKHVYSLKHGQTWNTNEARLAYKNGAKRGVMKQLTNAGPEQRRGLLQYWRGAKNMMFYSWWPSLKQYTIMLKILCKIKANKELQHKVYKGCLK